MKKYTLKLIIAVFCGALLMASCGESAQNTTDADQSVMEDKEHNSTFICPMYCEGSGSAEAGNCPVCGMDYVENENANGHGHSHSHDHHNSNH